MKAPDSAHIGGGLYRKGEHVYLLIRQDEHNSAEIENENGDGPADPGWYWQAWRKAAPSEPSDYWPYSCYYGPFATEAEAYADADRAKAPL